MTYKIINGISYKLHNCTNDCHMISCCNCGGNGCGCGGCYSCNACDDCLNSIEVYDDQSKKWIEVVEQ